MHRLTHHPILQGAGPESLAFTFDGQRIGAVPGETISSALMAAGIRVFGTHSKDGSSQGIYCANGQCSQCLVIADGVPVKACMTLVKEGMHVQSLHGLPELPETEDLPPAIGIPTVDVDVLIIGGGPAGLSAALELGSAGVDVLLVDDKDRL